MVSSKKLKVVNFSGNLGCDFQKVLSEGILIVKLLTLLEEDLKVVRKI